MIPCLGSEDLAAFFGKQTGHIDEVEVFFLQHADIEGHHHPVIGKLCAGDLKDLLVLFWSAVSLMIFIGVAFYRKGLERIGINWLAKAQREAFR